MAKKEPVVCKPCGNMVMVTDLGSAVVECWECGTEMVPKAKAAAKKPALKALPKKTAAKKAAVKKAPAKKAAARKKK